MKTMIRPATLDHWAQSAACLLYEPSMWDTPQPRSQVDEVREFARARIALSICRGCPVRLPCLVQAMESRENRRGLIRGGKVFNDNGSRRPSCASCGRPVLARLGGWCETCIGVRDG